MAAPTSIVHAIKVVNKQCGSESAGIVKDAGLSWGPCPGIGTFFLLRVV